MKHFIARVRALKHLIPLFFYLRPWTRHSLVLMVAGLVYVAYGVSLVMTQLTTLREISLAAALYFFPIDFWGVVWILAGLLSILSSRWPSFAETWGYMVLTGLASGWSATYILGVFFLDAPHATGVAGCLQWGLVAFLWWAISGLLNPDKVIIMVTDRGCS